MLGLHFVRCRKMIVCTFLGLELFRVGAPIPANAHTRDACKQLGDDNQDKRCQRHPDGVSVGYCDLSVGCVRHAVLCDFDDDDIEDERDEGEQSGQDDEDGRQDGQGTALPEEGADGDHEREEREHACDRVKGKGECY